MTNTTSAGIDALPLTCAHLYQSDPTFRAGIDTWVANRRCPLELHDFLLEAGLPSSAACAQWAAWEPDRMVYAPIRGLDERGGQCGPYPTLAFYATGGWYWFSTSRVVLYTAEEIPAVHIPPDSSEGTIRWDTVAEAILWLLDNWRP